MAANANDAAPTTAFRAAAPAASGASPAPAQGQSPGQGTLTINAQYIKDLSFEAPNAAQALMLMQKNQPEISVNLDVKAHNLQDSIYEVTLEVRTECKIANQTGFVAELTYAGLVTMTVPPEHVQPLLLIECPRLLFPFARGILANMTRDGGFPPLMLGMVDFVAMYQKSLQEQGKAEAKPTA